MKNYLYILSLIMIPVMTGCSSDDDGGGGNNLRDRAEVEAENMVTIENFLETHSYTVTSDPQNPNYDYVRFDPITDTGNETPIIESDALKTKTVTIDTLTYTLYYLDIDSGAPTSYPLTGADRAILSYRTLSIDLELADASAFPTPANFPGGPNSSAYISGASRGMAGFRGASDFTENNDGSITYSDDYGIGAVFIPSGLAYFSNAPLNSGIGSYEPIIFSFRIYQSIQADHDDDGIPSAFEDTNNDGFVRTDDTDGDGQLNYLDSDDDGDGVPTSEEIEVNDDNGDGIITEDEINFLDFNDDGTPDYLDPSA